MPRPPNNELPEACVAGKVLDFCPPKPEKRFEGLASLCPCDCGGAALVGAVEPVVEDGELPPDIS